MREKIDKDDLFQFEEVSLLGKNALFTSMRLDRTTLTEGVYAYDIRSSDDDGFYAAGIANEIMVNHFGTVLTNVPYDLGKDGYIILEDEKDFWFTDHGCMSVNQYAHIHRMNDKKVQSKSKDFTR
jgi:hypothetical protein